MIVFESTVLCSSRLNVPVLSTIGTSVFVDHVKEAIIFLGITMKYITYYIYLLILQLDIEFVK